MKKTIFIMLLSFSIIYGQGNILRVEGDSLIGKRINGETIREVHGNVVMYQDNVIIKCDTAIQYITKERAELIGNVIILQDSIVIKTTRGFYYDDSKISFSNNGVFYTDGHITLTADNGYYYYDEKRAFFYGNVVIHDLVTKLNADRFYYYDDADKAVAAGNVTVIDTSLILQTDSLINYRNENTTFAFNNVILKDLNNSMLIKGNYLESKNDYSKVTGNAFLMKIDTLESGEKDTLFVKAKIMESYSDSTNRLICTDSVRILKGKFASVNNFTIYYRDKDRIFTYKLPNDQMAPVIWNENTQILGDTIDIITDNNKLERMIIKSDSETTLNALLVTQNIDYPKRYDQISGAQFEMFFESGKLNKTVVSGNMLSIYYLYEENKPNGLIKSSSQSAVIYFIDNKVDKVKLFGKPASEYYPENLVTEKEIDFTLPDFILIKDKPVKDEFIKN
ncbi:OstA-like protein [Melioribacter sp. OK-6-Me]|uniref:OstA-like protein n=1 Tax=unclassified Melioribacter TaxID=2627329 RepID=UPI003ED97B63